MYLYKFDFSRLTTRDFFTLNVDALAYADAKINNDLPQMVANQLKIFEVVVKLCVSHDIESAPYECMSTVMEDFVAQYTQYIQEIQNNAFT